ncbi:MAG: hypothetical protein WCV59_00130 [Parcubacteria group bacterium]|jgi:hypothetical protein
MRIFKLILTILKNLILITFDESRKLLKRSKVARWILVVLIIAAIGCGGFRWYKNKTDPNNPDMSLSDAAKIGTVTTHKLMVEIESSKCPPEKASGCYERGDIVVILPGERDFSDSEKAGFLILKMDLTDKQAELLLHPVEKISQGIKNISPMPEQIKIRRYAVDLKKIGIGDDVQAGKVMDQIYKWDIVQEK